MTIESDDPILNGTLEKMLRSLPSQSFNLMNSLRRIRGIEDRVAAEPADHVDHASARRHAREAATTVAWRDSEE